MDRRVLVEVAAVLVAVLAAVAAVLCCCNDSGQGKAVLNEGVMASEFIQVTDVSTGSSFQGSVYVVEYEDALQVRVVATIHIDSSDFGGVAISCTQDVTVTELVCDYAASGRTVSFYTLAGEDEYSNVVDVGRNYYSTSGMGGDCSLLFTWTYAGDSGSIDCFDFMVEVGSATSSEGYGIVGTTIERFSIGLEG